MILYLVTLQLLLLIMMKSSCFYLLIVEIVIFIEIPRIICKIFCLLNLFKRFRYIQSLHVQTVQRFSEFTQRSFQQRAFLDVLHKKSAYFIDVYHFCFCQQQTKQGRVRQNNPHVLV